MPVYIEHRARRINVKSKRRRNLIKKAIELRNLCGLEVLILMKDSEFNKLTVYNSSTENFSMEMALHLMPHDGSEQPLKLQCFSDKDYHNLKCDKDDHQNLDLD